MVSSTHWSSGANNGKVDRVGPRNGVRVRQQLLSEAGKHSGVIWTLEPPGDLAWGASCTRWTWTPCSTTLTNCVPIGWIDLEGNVDSFKLKPPFEPPGFLLPVEGTGSIDYQHFQFTKACIAEVYDMLCMQNIGLGRRVGDA